MQYCTTLHGGKSNAIKGFLDYFSKMVLSLFSKFFLVCNPIFASTKNISAFIMLLQVEVFSLSSKINFCSTNTINLNEANIL